jgi:hypothetical protein
VFHGGLCDEGLQFGDNAFAQRIMAALAFDSSDLLRLSDIIRLPARPPRVRKSRLRRGTSDPRIVKDLK